MVGVETKGHQSAPLTLLIASSYLTESQPRAHSGRAFLPLAMLDDWLSARRMAPNAGRGG